jgi:plastocyanin
LAAVALIALIGAFTGCSDDKKPVALTVKASSSGGQYSFDIPKEIDGGTVAVTLDNTDSSPHDLGLVRVKDGTSAQKFTDEVLAQEDSPIPDYLLGATGIGTTAPGTKVTATQKLEPGTYIYFCTFGEGDDAHWKHGMLGTVTVKGTKGKGDLPKSTASVSAKEYGFDISGLKAGANTLKFSNTGQQFHHAQFFPITSGSTLDDVKAFLSSSEGPSSGGPPPPVDFEKGVGTAVLGPGQDQVVDFQLPAGDYAVLCFLSDKSGGEPHFQKGMLTELKVS